MALSSGAGDTDKLAKLQHIYETAAKQPGVADMPTDMLWQQIQAKESSRPIVIVDVREAPELQVSVLPGPCLSKAEFEQYNNDHFKEHTVVCYCTAGVRSGRYAAQLCKKGLRAHNLEGGILGWLHAGYPVVQQAEPHAETKRVHVYAPRWALQPEGYEPVVFDKKQRTWTAWLLSWF